MDFVFKIEYIHSNLNQIDFLFWNFIYCIILDDIVTLIFSDGAVMPSWFDIHEIPITAVSYCPSILIYNLVFESQMT